MFSDPLSLTIYDPAHSKKKTVSSSSAVHIGKICWLSSTPNEAIIFALLARGMRAGQKEKTMKKAIRKRAEPEMRGEYDFSRGVRGKYARRYAQGTNVVVLQPDVARVFPNAAAVNESLRALAGIIRRQKTLASK